MEIVDLPISPTNRSKLVSAGYTTLHSLSSISPSQLANKINVALDEAMDILNAVAVRNSTLKLENSHSLFNGAQTAWDMLSEEQTLRHIRTSCEELDNILGGGIHCKEVTEVGGVPGIGKTQLGMQLAVNVQIPDYYGGLGGKAIYIDTEGSFMAERAYQIAQACIEDIHEFFLHHRKSSQNWQKEMNPDNFLANIFYFRICSSTEQCALVDHLNTFLTDHNDVKIIIIDSISFHLRQDFDDLGARTRLIGEHSLKLMKLAKKFSLAVVLLNQSTIKFSEGAYELTLALGESWCHSCTNRIVLEWNGNERRAFLKKSPSLKEASAPYTITSKGIRSSNPNNKRQRMT